MPHIEFRPETPARQPEGAENYGLPWRDLAFPQELLDRHGATVLDPSTAPLDEGERRPDSTVYRTNVLLIPAQVLDRNGLGWINEQLAAIGLAIVSYDTSADDHDERPRWHAAVLGVAKQGKDVVVDAWRALRVLRRALADFPDSRRKEYLAKIALDHLLVGSAFAGAGAGISGEPATSGHGVPDLGGFATPTGGYARTPVTVVAGPPARRPEADIGGRRPVLVIPDTGLPRQGHSWFLPVTTPDSFLSVSVEAQKSIEAAVDTALRTTKMPAARLVGYEEVTAPPNPLLGTPSSQTGHGLMQAGLVCQIAPDAKVLMLRVMYADGVVVEAALHAALDHVFKKIQAGFFVDVVTFACGYFHETADDEAFTPTLMEKINHLRERGVVVVAAAGNYASNRAFWPGAGAKDGLRNLALAPMLAVGAKNPDGTVAIFSNEHEAIQWLAPGAAVVSTFPPGIKGSGAPDLRPPDVHPPGRASFDRDNYNEFATWSGSSFAVPILGAAIMALMIEDFQTLDLPVTDAQTAIARAHRVVGKLRAGILPEITPI
ncbi:S8/S53 family peptidase [Streptosporangium sp. NPDC006007]|uniref:S8/S53 family peptidase n=1 Tax=Streptosporangium sp. NPDC006007 TaxID=3154575 RepID=UPI0033A9FC6E